MRSSIITLLLLIFTSLLSSGTVLADENAKVIYPHLKIGVKEAPPFVIKEENGSWSGISINLWELIAARMGFTYEYQERGISELIDGVENGSLDASVAALTVTSDRESRIDNTHPYFTTGLGIAVPVNQEQSLSSLLSLLFSSTIAKAVLFISLIPLFVGLLIWWAEHTVNKAHFGGTTIEGIGSGYYFAYMVLSTVGLGDKAPITFVGRTITIVWMFGSMFVTPVFTGIITTTFTVSQLTPLVQDVSDLYKVRVGTIGTTTTSYHFLKGRHIKFDGYHDMHAALRALKDGKIDALVYDAPLLQYHIKRSYDKELMVLPGKLRREDYAIALPPGSPLRERVNQIILEIIQSNEWDENLSNYLG